MYETTDFWTAFFIEDRVGTSSSNIHPVKIDNMYYLLYLLYVFLFLCLIFGPVIVLSSFGAKSWSPRGREVKRSFSFLPSGRMVDPI